jgi:hypothetical protein
MSMTDQLHPGPHPDPELLNAFIEGVLPEHERLEYVSHFAECARCREIVYLAQPTQPVRVPSTAAPIKRRWYAIVPELSGALAACALIVAVSLYWQHTPTASKAPANVKPAQQVQVSAPTILQQPTGLARSAKKAKRSDQRAAAPASDSVAELRLPALLPSPQVLPLTEPRASLNFQPPVNGGVASLSAEKPVEPSAAAAAPTKRYAAKFIPRDTSPVSTLSEIKGAVTDPAGAPISRAAITVLSLDGTPASTTQTDSTGQFTVAPLPAGKYKLEIESPGFQTASSQVELKAHDQTVIAATLIVGSVAQSVEVTSLPRQLPIAATVTNGTRILAMDSAGALFLCPSVGKRWKAVKPKWQGKVVQIVSLAQPGSATSDAGSPIFQLTTDSGAVWLTENGTRWHPQKK